MFGESIEYSWSVVSYLWCLGLTLYRRGRRKCFARCCYVCLPQMHHFGGVFIFHLRDEGCHQFHAVSSQCVGGLSPSYVNLSNEKDNV